MAARVPEPRSRKMNPYCRSDSTVGWPHAQQRVVRGCHEHMRVRGKGFCACGQFFGWAAHDGNVHLIGMQHVDQLLAVTHRQPNVHPRVLTLKLAEQPGQKVLGGADHANGQRACFHLLQAGGGVFGVFQRGQHFAGVNQHVFACGGQGHFATAPLEQRQAYMALQFLDLHGDGGRGQVHGFSGAGKAQVLGYLGKHTQLTKGGVFH